MVAFVAVVGGIQAATPMELHKYHCTAVQSVEVASRQAASVEHDVDIQQDRLWYRK